MKKSLVLAPGVIFEEEPHEYFLNGKKLHGITGLIASRMNLRMPEDFAGEARNEGLHIHKAIQNWLNGGQFESIHPGALWIKQALEKKYGQPQEQCYAEVLVSDMERYASSVDIIHVEQDSAGQNRFTLFDIKRSFKRPYVSWQLSVYKYFIEKASKKNIVHNMFCIAMKDRTMYPIQPYSVKDVEELLYAK